MRHQTHILTACRRAAALVAACSAVLSGCAQLTPDAKHRAEASEQISGIDRHSAFPSITRSSFEQVNLVQMVDPRGLAARDFPTAWAQSKPDTDDGLGQRYDLALAWFRQDKTTNNTDKRLHRNSVQDKMLAISTSRCNVFKTFLRRQQSDVNFYLGSATTAAGVLGAVLPGVTASRNMAGAAGLFSGLQAEFNSAYYSNLAAHVIVQGIELRQARLHKELIQGRHGQEIDDYSMEAAIADAIYIDGTCSTVVGLLEAADSIKEVNNPGLGRAAEVIASVRAASEIASATRISDLADSGKLAKLLKQSNTVNSPLVVVSVKPDLLTGSPLPGQLAAASRVQAQIDEVVDQTGARLAQAFTQAQSKLVKAEQATDLTASGVKAAFMATLNTATASGLAIANCVAALDAPTKALGSAEAVARLEPRTAEARTQVQQQLAGARANADTAVRNVQALAKAARELADDAASQWEPLLATAKLTKAALDAKTPAPPAAALKTLCPAPAA